MDRAESKCRLNSSNYTLDRAPNDFLSSRSAARKFVTDQREQLGNLGAMFTVEKLAKCAEGEEDQNKSKRFKVAHLTMTTIIDF